MKISFNVLGRLCIDVVVRRDASGMWVLHGVFPTFPDRPGYPHLSLFAKPRGGVFTPHFTANRRNPREFRSVLAKIRPEALTAFQERIQPDMMRAYAAGLTPVDLLTLTDDGWTAHGVNPRAVVRWMKRYCKPGSVLEVNEDFALTFAGHVCRHWMKPRVLAELDAWHALPLLRWRDGQAPEMCTLFNFPEGVWVPDPEQGLRQVHAPGCYVLKLDWMHDEVLEKRFRIERLKSIGERLQRYLARYPRRSPPPDHETLPRFVGHLLGLYGDDLIKIALALAIQGLEGSPPEPDSGECTGTGEAA